MNSILSYKSDSDNSDNEPDAKRQKLDGERDNLDLSPDKNYCDNSSYGCENISKCSDYFGVIDEESSSEEEGYVNAVKSKQNLSDGTVVPHSAFWKDKNEDDWCQPSNVWKRNIQPLTREGSEANCSNDISIHIASNSKHEANVKQYTSKKAKSNKIAGQSSPVEDGSYQNESIFMNKSPFFIHHKIGPLINCAKSIFRYPKKKQKHTSAVNSVINKIKWSCPQYSHLLAVASSEKLVHIWHCFDDEIKRVRSITHHTKAVKDISWSKCGKTVLSCGYDKTACITDVETGTLTAHCDHSNFVTATQFHPIDYNNFVTGSKDELFCWDKRNTSRPAITFKYKDTFGQVQDLVFNRDGSEIFTCNDLVSRDSSDRNVMAWDFRKGVVVSNQIYQERFTCARLKVHPSEAEFYAQSQGDYIAIFSTIRPYKMKKVKRFEGHKVSGYSVGFDISPDGNFIVSGSANGKIPIYDMHRAKCIQQLNMGRNVVCVDVAWHPVLPGTIAAATWDGQIAIWQ